MLKEWISSSSGAKIAGVNMPIFIVGCGRSGTTLLFDLMAQHPQLERTAGYPDGEDHEGWIKFGKCVMAGIGNVNSDRYGNGINGYHACLHMTAQDVTTEIAEDMHSYYLNDVLKNERNKRVLNKCPHNSNKIGYMLGIFPDAKFIHIVRDCEPTVASWIAVMNDHPNLTLYWPDEEFPCFTLLPKPETDVALRCLNRHSRFFPGGGAQMFVDYWIKTNMGIEKQMQGCLKQLLVVRYEDLVARPAHVLNGIAKFCELNPHDFAVPDLDLNTASKHRHILTHALRDEIDNRTKTARRYFRYLPSSRIFKFKFGESKRLLSC